MIHAQRIIIASIISPERLQVFSRNLDNVNKIQAGGLKYLHMEKMTLLNPTYNLLTNFIMEKIRCFHFIFNFLTWHEVPDYLNK